MSIIVQEYEPDKFRRFQKGRVTKTSTKATRIISYEGGAREQTDIDVPPYDVEIILSSVEGWGDDELAACRLYRVPAFIVPDGKVRTGDPRYARVNGVITETYDVADRPPSPTVEQKFDSFLRQYGLTRDEVAGLLAKGRP